MAQITSSVGLISGINTSDLITKLLSLDQQPVNQLQNRIKTASAQKDSFTALAGQVTALQGIAKDLNTKTVYQNTTAKSSDESVLTATTLPGASAGTYQLQVAQLVSAQQAITGGFTDPNNAKVGAGTITIEQGGGEASHQTLLSELNGGQGVSRGQFRLTDRSGKSTVIDASGAITLDDVANKINTSLETSVRARVTQQGLQLTDESGSTLQDLTLRDIGDGTTARDLGLTAATGATVSADGNDLVGSNINTIGRLTPLTQLNDGRGVRSGSAAGGPDFVITAGGTAFDVNITSNIKTVGDLADLISNTGSGTVLGITADGKGLTINHGGGISIAAANNPNTAKDLGFADAADGTSLEGRSVIAGVNSVLLSSLKGGSGLALGTINVQDRTGAVATIDLSRATSFRDVIDGFNDPANGLKLSASLNSAGNGIQLTDISGAGGDLIISNGSATGATDLGIAGTFKSTAPVVSGTNLHRQYVSENSQLQDLNGGNGVAEGSFTITAANGATTTVKISKANYSNLGQVITSINARAIGVTASINANGSGLLLTDSTGGTGQLKVEDVDATTGKDLNITGTAALGVNTLDGAFAKTITLDANDTLNTVQTKINTLGFGVTASIINDGTSAAPYRLSLSAKNTGLDGRIVFDAGTTNLQTRNLVNAQNAAVFVGGKGTQPLLITSSKNSLANVIPNVTVNLTGVSEKPVTLSITPSGDSISADLQKFTDTFNAITTSIDTQSKFDKDTGKGGLLLGDSTAQSIQLDLYSILSGVVQSGGKYRILQDVGLKIGDGGQLSFDADKFKSAYAADAASVQNLFAQTDKGFGTLIKKTVDRLIDPLNGVITVQDNTLGTRVQDFQNQVTQLNTIIAGKKTRLQTQFANLESTLSTLQSQGTAISSIGGLTTTTTRSSTSK